MTFFSFGGAWAERRAEEGLGWGRKGRCRADNGFSKLLSSGGVAGPAQEVQKQKKSPTAATPLNLPPQALPKTSLQVPAAPEATTRWEH